MGLINALTENAFGLDIEGRPIYRPLFGREGPRLLPSNETERSLRLSVKNFYRYIVFVVSPIVIILVTATPILVDSYADILPAGLAAERMHYIVSTAVGIVLALPAMLWIRRLGRDYPPIAADQVVTEENRTSLGGAFVLMALTLMVGSCALIVVCILIADQLGY